MAKLENIYEEVLLAAGSTVTIDLTDHFDRYVFTGSGALAGAITITTTGTPVLGQILKIQYNCTFTAGGASVTILGNVLNSTLIGKTFIVEAYYNGASWDLHLLPDFYESQIVSNSHIVDATLTNAKMVNSTLDVGKMTDAVNKNVLVVECSFEAGEQANNTVIMPANFTLNTIDYEVIKALANTDAGTIVPKINGSNVTLSSAISIPLSTVINTLATTNCTAANTGVAGNSLTFVAAKTTAGGKVRLSITWTKS